MTEEEITRLMEERTERYRQARAHVSALSAEHNADLHRWCVRRRRYESARRVTLAVCIFAVATLNVSSAFAQPPKYKTITLAGDMDRTETIDAIGATLHEK